MSSTDQIGLAQTFTVQEISKLHSQWAVRDTRKFPSSQSLWKYNPRLRALLLSGKFTPATFALSETFQGQNLELHLRPAESEADANTVFKWLTRPLRLQRSCPTVTTLKLCTSDSPREVFKHTYVKVVPQYHILPLSVFFLIPKWFQFCRQVWGSGP